MTFGAGEKSLQLTKVMGVHADAPEAAIEDGLQPAEEEGLSPETLGAVGRRRSEETGELVPVEPHARSSPARPIPSHARSPASLPGAYPRAPSWRPKSIFVIPLRSPLPSSHSV